MQIHMRRLAPLVAGGVVLAASACAAGEPEEEVGGSEVEVGGEVLYQSWRLADPGAIGELHRDWVERFNEEFGDLTVVGEEVPFEQRTDILLNQTLAGSPPDVVAIQTAEVPTLSRHLLPLDEYFEGEGPEFEEAFLDGARDFVSWDGSYYGVPVELGPVDGFYYNRDVLDAAGVDPEEAVSSWESFTEALEAIITSDPDAEGLIMAGADPSRVGYMYPWFYTAGAPLGTDEEIEQAICSPEGAEAFTFLTELFTEHGYGPNPVDLGFDEYVSAFATGNAGFAQGGAWMHDIFLDANPELEGKLGVTHVPTQTDDSEVGFVLDAVALVIPREAQNPDAAWEFIKYLSSPEAQLEGALETGFLPTLEEAASDPQITDQDRLGRYAEFAVDYGYPAPRTESLPELRQEIWERWQSALLGQTDPEAAINTVCTNLDRVLG